MEILRAIDIAEESEIKAMQKRQRELHLIPTPVCYLDVEVINKNGEVTAKYSDRSKSWVRNFYNWCVTQQMCCDTNCKGASYGAGYLNPKQHSGAIATTTTPIANKATDTTIGNGYRGAAGTDTIGILIGTGDTPESFDDYCLSSKIVTGHATGEMDYQAMARSIPTWFDSPDYKMEVALERSFLNDSGGSITVKETGLSAYLFTSGSSPILVARDVLASAIDVANESLIKVTYTLQIAFPS